MINTQLRKFSLILLTFFIGFISFESKSQSQQDLINLAKKNGLNESQINSLKNKYQPSQTNQTNQTNQTSQVNQTNNNSQQKTNGNNLNNTKNNSNLKNTQGQKIQGSGDPMQMEIQNLRMINDPNYIDPFLEQDSTILAEIEMLKKLEEKNKKKVFGENLFKDKDLNLIPNLNIATPINYILGAGDQLLIDVYGNSLNSYQVNINPEGNIIIANLKPIHVAGMKFEDAKEKIISSMRSIYRGLNLPGNGTNCHISLGNIRTISVILAGEVTNPGSYNVPSLTTGFNALYLAGGPNEFGSYREINIIRNNKILSTIDIYDFLNSGKLTGDLVLQDQDIVFVPTVKTRVELEGEVKRPLKFELKQNETLQDLINYGGGFNDVAYKRFITGTRISDRELEKINISQDQFDKFLPKSGDIFYVDSLIVRYKNQVTLVGPVYREGTYAIDENVNTVKKLIENAEGIRNEAYLNRAVLKRNYDAFNKESINFNLGELLKGKIKDIPLMREDSLVIFDKANLKEEEYINIYGEVNLPSKLVYYKNMTLGDAILLANGFQNSASYKNIEVSRRKISHGIIENNNQSVEIFNLSVDSSFNQKDNEMGANFILQPYDVISVRVSPDYEKQATVHIIGEVFYPGTYTLSKNVNKVSDLIKNTGGIKPDGYIGGAKIKRNNLIIGVDLSKILSNPDTKENFLLIDKDSIEIPKYNPLIEIMGAVNNPVSINYNNSYSFKSYINFAGGFSNEASKRNAYAIQVNGKSKSLKKFLFFKVYPKIKPGDKIFVPFSNENDEKLRSADIISLASTLSSLSLSIITLIRVLK